MNLNKNSEFVGTTGIFDEKLGPVLRRKADQITGKMEDLWRQCDEEGNDLLSSFQPLVQRNRATVVSAAGDRRPVKMTKGVQLKVKHEYSWPKSSTVVLLSGGKFAYSARRASVQIVGTHVATGASQNLARGDRKSRMTSW